MKKTFKMKANINGLFKAIIIILSIIILFDGTPL